MDSPKIATEDHILACYVDGPMSESVFLRQKVAKAGGQPLRNQRLPELVALHGWFAGKETGQGTRCGNQLSESSIVAGPDAGVPLRTAGKISGYAI